MPATVMATRLLAIKTKLTADNVAKIQPGMTRTQVEALLGPPNSTETKDFLSSRRRTQRISKAKIRWS